MTTINVLPRATYADYLAAQQTCEHRLEFIDNIIVGMAGSSFEHTAIGGRFVSALGTRVSRDCRHTTSSQRFWIESKARARYSDGAVICGKSEHPPHDGQATTNPTIVVEVLPPSSAGTDGGAKREDYQSLPSLQAYVIAAQDAQIIQVYRRALVVGWSLDIYHDGDHFELPGLTRMITVAEIYDNVLDSSGRSLLR